MMSLPDRAVPRILCTEFATEPLQNPLQFPQNIPIQLSFPHRPVVPNDFLLLNTKEDVVEGHWIFLGTLDFYCMDKNVLHFSNDVPQKKEIHTGLEWHDVE